MLLTDPADTLTLHLPIGWARPRHEIRVIKRCVRLRRIMQLSHLRGVLSTGVMAASATPIIPAQRAPFALPRLDESPFTQWIEA